MGVSASLEMGGARLLGLGAGGLDSGEGLTERFECGVEGLQGGLCLSQCGLGGSGVFRGLRPARHGRHGRHRSAEVFECRLHGRDSRNHRGPAVLACSERLAPVGELPQALCAAPLKVGAALGGCGATRLENLSVGEFSGLDLLL